MFANSEIASLVLVERVLVLWRKYVLFQGVKLLKRLDSIFGLFGSVSFILCFSVIVY